VKPLDQMLKSGCCAEGGSKNYNQLSNEAHAAPVLEGVGLDSLTDRRNSRIIKRVEKCVDNSLMANNYVMLR